MIKNAEKVKLMLLLDPSRNYLQCMLSLEGEQWKNACVRTIVRRNVAIGVNREIQPLYIRINHLEKDSDHFDSIARKGYPIYLKEEDVKGVVERMTQVAIDILYQEGSEQNIREAFNIKNISTTVCIKRS